MQKSPDLKSLTRILETVLRGQYNVEPETTPIFNKDDFNAWQNNHHGVRRIKPFGNEVIELDAAAGQFMVNRKNAHSTWEEAVLSKRELDRRAEEIKGKVELAASQHDAKQDEISGFTETAEDERQLILRRKSALDTEVYPLQREWDHLQKLPIDVYRTEMQTLPRLQKEHETAATNLIEALAGISTQEQTIKKQIEKLDEDIQSRENDNVQTINAALIRKQELLKNLQEGLEKARDANEEAKHQLGGRHRQDQTKLNEEIIELRLSAKKTSSQVNSSKARSCERRASAKKLNRS